MQIFIMLQRAMSFYTFIPGNYSRRISILLQEVRNIALKHPSIQLSVEDTRGDGQHVEGVLAHFSDRIPRGREQLHLSIQTSPLLVCGHSSVCEIQVGYDFGFHPEAVRFDNLYKEELLCSGCMRFRTVETFSEFIHDMLQAFSPTHIYPPPPEIHDEEFPDIVRMLNEDSSSVSLHSKSLKRHKRHGSKRIENTPKKKGFHPRERYKTVYHSNFQNSQ